MKKILIILLFPFYACAQTQVGTNQIKNEAITYAKFQQLTGLSIFGRSANTTGVGGSITGTDGQILRVSGTTLGFGTVPATSITNTPAGGLAATTTQAAVDEIDLEKQDKHITWNIKTTNYTPISGDEGEGFLMRSTGALAFTIPPYTTTNFVSGTQFIVLGDSTGTTTITQGSGVTFESAASTFTLTGNEYAVVTKKNTTNSWFVLIGEDPAGLTNPMTTAGDIITATAGGTPARLAIGAALTILRVNAGGTALEYAASAAGITNGAAANEIPKSDGTDLDPSGLGAPSAGNLDLGLSGTAGAARTFQAVGSATDIDINIDAKGTGKVDFLNQITEYSAPSASVWNQFVYPTTNGFGGTRGISGSTFTFEYGTTSDGTFGGTVNTLGGSNFYIYDNQNSRRAFGIGANTDAYFGASSTSFGMKITRLGVVTVGGNTTNQGQILIGEDADNGAHVSGFTVPASLAADLIYTLPSAAPTVDNSVLTSTTGGTLTWTNTTLDLDASDVGNVGTGEDQLYSYTLPAGKLATDEQSLRIRVALSLTANGNNKRVKVKFGAVNIVDPGINGISGTVVIDCQVIRTGAATQKCNCSVMALSGSHAVLSDMTETLSGTVAIVVTGEAVSNNDIIKESVSVKFEP